MLLDVQPIDISQRELQRNEKALAETAALLTRSKKARAIWLKWLDHQATCCLTTTDLQEVSLI